MKHFARWLGKKTKDENHLKQAYKFLLWIRVSNDSVSINSLVLIHIKWLLWKQTKSLLSECFFLFFL